MSMTKEALLSYLRQVEQSIERNIKELNDGDKEITDLTDGINKFYQSLFDLKRIGVFKPENIDKHLVKSAQSRVESKALASRAEPPPRIGTGKGSPLKPRKLHVSNRQKKLRASRSFDMSTASTPKRKRFTESPPNASQESSQDIEDAPRVGQASGSQVDVERASPTIIEEAATTTRVPVVEDELEMEPQQQQPFRDEGTLRSQFRTTLPPTRSGVQHFHVLAATSKTDASSETSSTYSSSESGTEPTEDELGLFARQIIGWKQVNAHMEYALRDLWLEVENDGARIHDIADDLVDKLLMVNNLSNGVANSMAHLKGYIVDECHRHLNESQTPLEQVRDEIETLLQRRELLDYHRLLVDCNDTLHCDECSAVLRFDKDYERCRTTSSNHTPLLADRPIHCALVDPSVRASKARYKGLSSSSLQKCQYFYHATPKFSPPTFATAIPTNVQALTTAYMQSYAASFHVTDDLVPPCWHLNLTPNDYYSILVPLRKDQIHLFDGDGGEILIRQNDDNILQKSCTHTNTIRFRLPLCDAPEIGTAFKITRQRPEESTTTTLGTAEVGIEAMRAAREIIFNAKQVHLKVRVCGSASSQNPTPTINIDSPQYKRALCPLVVTQVDGSQDDLSHLLARAGYMFSCFKYGVDYDLQMSMYAAFRARTGMFRLPDETRQQGFLPWHIKAGQKVHTPVRIRNVGVGQPETLWFGQQSAQATCDDKFFVQSTQSPNVLEAKCFVQQSTIPNSGRGLWISRHAQIAAGQFLCLYAKKPTTTAEMDEAESSYAYAMNVETAKLWFDADKEDGVCLGRFANQLHVLESLKQMQELSRKASFHEIREEDWKVVNDQDLLRATVKYVHKKGQLILVSAKILPVAGEAHELFAHYGDLRSYWLSLIRKNPKRFPPEMGSIVKWFLESADCNWTSEQKQSWFQR